MNQVTKRRLLFQIALIIAVLGAIHTLVFLIMSRGYADTWVDYNVEGYQSTYITLHQMASIGVFLAAMGLAYLPFHFFNKENHLWMNSQEEPGERRKSAMLVSIGIGLAVLGLGTAAIILHQNYSLTRETIPPHRWILLALVRAILGFVGVGIIAFGVFLYREPDLEFGEEQHLFRRRPLWQGGSVIVLGLLILFATMHFSFSYFTTADYSYVDVETVWLLSLVGTIASIFVFVFGLIMIGRRPPSIRPMPFPYEPTNREKR